ncbi:MAG: type II toxin-antitoxin system mRNA interferase toxin, RelE/StbE family [Candidatus Vogelbacteria bacterium]|nr:type II toxin-antitoxin system mRNA interferase toxin, RelE/StbE family [Candidatus Vogelbacteria bacterium]
MNYGLHYSSRFRKRYKRLPPSLRRKVVECLHLLLKNEFNPLLGNHSLHGSYVGCRSVNITGDIRLIYEKYVDGLLNLITLGTHSELYE